MSAHTPGPWHARGMVVILGNNEGAFDLYHCPQPYANARLIAAAPELLIALQAWVAGCGDEHFSTKEQCRQLIERSGDIIAKALGK